MTMLDATNTTEEADSEDGTVDSTVRRRRPHYHRHRGPANVRFPPSRRPMPTTRFPPSRRPVPSRSPAPASGGTVPGYKKLPGKYLGGFAAGDTRKRNKMQARTR